MKINVFVKFTIILSCILQIMLTLVSYDSQLLHKRQSKFIFLLQNKKTTLLVFWIVYLWKRKLLALLDHISIFTADDSLFYKIKQFPHQTLIYRNSMCASLLYHGDTEACRTSSRKSGWTDQPVLTPVRTSSWFRSVRQPSQSRQSACLSTSAYLPP